MNDLTHTNRVGQRSLAAFTALTDLFNCHQDFKNDPTQTRVDALTQAASNFQNKIEMLTQCIAMSVSEVLGLDSDNTVEGEQHPEGIKL